MANPEDKAERVDGIFGAEAMESAYWMDEIQVAIELPMGPPGPEGPEPTFGVDQVITMPPDGIAMVALEKSGEDGIWYFDFFIPQGPQGWQGEPGPPWTIKGEMDSWVPPVSASIGDAYLVNNPDGSQDMYVYGRVDNTEPPEYAWYVLNDFKGPKGDPTWAWVDDEVPPPDPAEGQIWFRPSAMGFVPTSLRVDGGVQFDQFGGHIWGDESGALLFGIGNLGGVAAHIPLARLSGEGLDVTAVTMNRYNVLVPNSGVLEFGTDGRTIRSMGTLKAKEPVESDDVVTKGYVDTASTARDVRFVNIGGDTMTGPLVLPPGDPASGSHAANKTYVDKKVGEGFTQAAADARYVNIGGDTMTGPLNVPNAAIGSHAVNLAQMNGALSGADVHRVNGARITMGTNIVRGDRNGAASFTVPYVIERSVVVSNGDYPANAVSIRLGQSVGGNVVRIASGLGYNKNTRINWVAS